LKRVQDIEGSVSVESALIIPVIMGVFIFFMSMMQIMYTHGKVQIALNEVCKDLTYDSYFFQELGIIEVNQALYSKGLEQSITVEDLRVLKQELTEVIPEVASDLNNLKFSNISEEISVENIDTILQEKSDVTSVLVKLYESMSKLSQSAGTEGGYFINTMLLRVYIKEKLKLYTQEIDADYTLVHASGFLEDNSGQIILSTEYQVPILFKRHTIRLKNGGYFHAFIGAGKFSASYNQVIKKSQYGKTVEGDDDTEDEDQDGFAKTVYVTEYGAKYHKNQKCFHIKVNVNQMRLKQVTGKSPCEHCGDGGLDLEDSAVVYTTKNSRVFHLDKKCHSIYHYISKFSEKEAINSGYGPCKSCSK